MERSAYWQAFAKSWDNEYHGWRPRINFERGKLADDTVPPVYYGGRLLRLENYLAIPTFLRRGRRLAI